MKNLICCFLVLIFLNCDPGDDKLEIINNTNHYIVVCDRALVSDTSKYNNDDKAIDNFDFDINSIKPKSRFKMITKADWESRFEQNDTVVFLVYDKDSIIKKRIEKRSQNYNIEQIIYVSKEYIVSSNWILKIDSINKPKVIKL